MLHLTDYSPPKPLTADEQFENFNSGSGDTHASGSSGFIFSPAYDTAPYSYDTSATSTYGTASTTTTTTLACTTATTPTASSDNLTDTQESATAAFADITTTKLNVEQSTSKVPSTTREGEENESALTTATSSGDGDDNGEHCLGALSSIHGGLTKIHYLATEKQDAKGKGLEKGKSRAAEATTEPETATTATTTEDQEPVTEDEDDNESEDSEEGAAVTDASDEGEDADSSAATASAAPTDASRDGSEPVATTEDTTDATPADIPSSVSESGANSAGSTATSADATTPVDLPSPDTETGAAPASSRADPPSVIQSGDDEAEERTTGDNAETCRSPTLEPSTSSSSPAINPTPDSAATLDNTPSPALPAASSSGEHSPSARPQKRQRDADDVHVDAENKKLRTCAGKCVEPSCPLPGNKDCPYKFCRGHCRAYKGDKHGRRPACRRHKVRASAGLTQGADVQATQFMVPQSAYHFTLPLRPFPAPGQSFSNQLAASGPYGAAHAGPRSGVQTMGHMNFTYRSSPRISAPSTSNAHFRHSSAPTHLPSSSGNNTVVYPRNPPVMHPQQAQMMRTVVHQNSPSEYNVPMNALYRSSPHVSAPFNSNNAHFRHSSAPTSLPSSSGNHAVASSGSPHGMYPQQAQMMDMVAPSNAPSRYNVPAQPYTQLPTTSNNINGRAMPGYTPAPLSQYPASAPLMQDPHPVSVNGTCLSSIPGVPPSNPGSSTAQGPVYHHGAPRGYAYSNGPGHQMMHPSSSGMAYPTSAPAGPSNQSYGGYNGGAPAQIYATPASTTNSSPQYLAPVPISQHYQPHSQSFSAQLVANYPYAAAASGTHPTQPAQSEQEINTPPPRQTVKTTYSTLAHALGPSKGF